MVRKLAIMLFACGLSASAAGASLIRYDFSGVLGASPLAATGPSAGTLLADSALLGASYSGFATFYSNTPDLNLSPTIASFAVQDFSVTVGNLTFTPANSVGAAGVQSDRFGLSFGGMTDISPSLAGLETGNFLISTHGTNLALSPVQTPSALFSTFGQGNVASGSSSFALVRGGAPTTFTVQTINAPESSTWVLIIGGFGLIGWVVRGRAKAGVYTPSLV